MEKSRAEKSLENSLQKENETHEEYLLVSDKLQRKNKELTDGIFNFPFFKTFQINHSISKFVFTFLS